MGGAGEVSSTVMGISGGNNGLVVGGEEENGRGGGWGDVEVLKKVVPVYRNCWMVVGGVDVLWRTGEKGEEKREKFEKKWG